MRKFIVILFLIFSTTINSQSNFKTFFNLSRPLKTWILFHPFKAIKAFEISKETNKIAASIKETNLLDGDAAGGQVDAFRHAYWMARLHQ